MRILSIIANLYFGNAQEDMKKYLLLFALSLFVLGTTAIYQYAKYTDKKLHITFCNVGQGDSIFIRTPQGADILIDGGPASNVLDCLANHMPFWDRDIEIIYLTHPDADHLTGLIDVFEKYNVLYFGTSDAPKDTDVFKQLNQHIAVESIKKNFIYRGDSVKLSDGVAIKTLWPTVEYTHSGEEDTNNYSLTQDLSYGSFHVLLTGDIPFQILNSIMPTLTDIDVFKPPHHGSKTGVDEYTFQHILPKAAVISVGKKNRYGHPNNGVLGILQQNNIPYYRTDEMGDIEFVTDGKTWKIK